MADIRQWVLRVPFEEGSASFIPATGREPTLEGETALEVGSDPLLAPDAQPLSPFSVAASPAAEPAALSETTAGSAPESPAALSDGASAAAGSSACAVPQPEGGAEPVATTYIFALFSGIFDAVNASNLPETVESCSQLDTLLSKAMPTTAFEAAFAGAPPPAAAPAAAAPSDLSAKGLLFKEGAEDGFDLRGSKLGPLWYAALRQNSQLKAEYDSVGRNYSAQREFRKSWAKQNYELELSKVAVVEKSDEWEGMTGEYMGFGPLCWELKSRRSGLNYLMSCLKAKQNGETFRGGREFITWNSWTGTYDVLYVKRQFGVSQSKQHILEYTADLKRPAPALPAAEQTPEKAPRLAAGPAGGAPAAAGGRGKPRSPPDASAEGGTGGGKGKGKGKDLTPEEAKKRAARRELDAKYAKLRALKNKYDAVQSVCADILSAIDNNPEWAWAVSQRPSINDAKKRLDAQKSVSEFWSAWALSPNFAAESKKNISPKELNEQFKHASTVEELIQALDKTLTKVQRMHRAAMSG